MIIVGCDPSIRSTGVCFNGEEPFVLQTKPIDNLEPIRATVLRVQAIMTPLFALGVCHFVVEAPLLRPMEHSHLFEAGIWYGEFVRQVYQSNCKATFVSAAKLKSYIGTRAKEDVPLAAFKKWGVEFSGDAGRDKIHAFALFKLGVELEEGTYELDAIRRRGKGGRVKAKKTQPAPQDAFGDSATQME